MNRALKYAQITSIYPHVSEDGFLRNGTRLGQCRKCLQCKSRDCKGYTLKSVSSGVEHFTCPYGLSVFAVGFDGETILINGMVETNLNTGCPKRLRRAGGSHKVRIHQIKEWRSVTLGLVKEISQEIEFGVTESISSLHDVKTAVSVVYRNAEGLISELPGADFDEKAENAPAKLQSLLKAVELLETRMSMASIVANPESAAYGKKRPAPVYKLFHKLCRLFEEQAAQKGVRVVMGGHSVRKPMAYDSLVALAMVLVDNAVKYSVSGEQVSISVNDSRETPPGVLVEVTSIGPVVPNGAELRIFERGYRSPGAKGFEATGSGLGLYIAKVVAEAHGFQVEYFGIPLSEDPHMGRNVFSFRMS